MFDIVISNLCLVPPILWELEEEGVGVVEECQLAGLYKLSQAL